MTLRAQKSRRRHCRETPHLPVGSRLRDHMAKPPPAKKPKEKKLSKAEQHERFVKTARALVRMKQASSWSELSRRSFRRKDQGFSGEFRRTLNPIKHDIAQVVPAGTLKQLSPDDIKPSANNPRFLFDDAPMQELRKNIATHGVLVPMTVFQPRGQTKFSILDGERRYRCVVELTKQGVLGAGHSPLKLPANIVEHAIENRRPSLYVFDP